jgi:hypothetical protein
LHSSVRFLIRELLNHVENTIVGHFSIRFPRGDYAGCDLEVQAQTCAATIALHTLEPLQVAEE